MPTRCFSGAGSIGRGLLGAGNTEAVSLLPVRVTEATASEAIAQVKRRAAQDAEQHSGTIQVELPKGQVRITGQRRCGIAARGAGVVAGMIGLAAGTQIWIVAGVTDMRRGFVGLSGMVQTALEQNPFSGQVFVFRGKRGDLIKLLWWDGDGLCLVRQATGARAVHLAASGERHGFADAGAAVDAAGRDRLAAAGAQLRAADGGVSEIIFIFAHILILL